MGVVFGRRVVNVYDIPRDILVNFVGRGLYLDRSSAPITLNVDVGCGLGYNEHEQIVVDNRVDDSKTEVFGLLTDVRMALDGRKLILTKTVTDYKVLRNCDGLIIDIVIVGTEDIAEEVVFTDYGYLGMARSTRVTTETEPNFYQA